jgi:hypothetical protein
MAAGLLSGLTDFLFGTVDNQQYLQEYAKQQLEAEAARKREAQAYAMQQQFGQYLQAVMNGTAPSMAQLQLSQGLGQIQQNQQSMAAGLGGPGAALARYGAATNIADAQAQMNQAAAIARAKEVQDARLAYGANANSMQQGSRGLFGDLSQNALGYAQVASGNSIGQFNRQEQDKGLGALFSGAGQAMGSYFGRQPNTGSSSSQPSDESA